MIYRVSVAGEEGFAFEKRADMFSGLELVCGVLDVGFGSLEMPPWNLDGDGKVMFIPTTGLRNVRFPLRSFYLPSSVGGGVAPRYRKVAKYQLVSPTEVQVSLDDGEDEGGGGRGMDMGMGMVAGALEGHMDEENRPLVRTITNRTVLGTVEGSGFGSGLVDAAKHGLHAPQGGQSQSQNQSQRWEKGALASASAMAESPLRRSRRKGADA